MVLQQNGGATPVSASYQPGPGPGQGVNGIAGVVDNLRLIPSGTGAGTVVNDNAPQPDVHFTGVENLNLVLQQADGDGVRVDGTTGNDALEQTPGATADSGSFSGLMN